jgi:hypothetical protein
MIDMILHDYSKCKSLLIMLIMSKRTFSRLRVMIFSDMIDMIVDDYCKHKSLLIMLILSKRASARLRVRFF